MPLRLLILLPSLVLLACQHQQPPARAPRLARNKICISPGERVDSEFAVNAARKVLQDSEQVGPLEPVRFDAGEDWDLITLHPVSPQAVVGGGGLVWVDRWSGCAILLRMIE